MSLDTDAYVKAVASHAMALAQFERIPRHEPKNAPGSGLTCAFWLQSVGPVPLDSGLAATSARVEITARIYQPMITEPQDEIDTRVGKAIDALINTLSGDFTLGGTVQSVDLLGKAGVPLSAQAGYQNVGGTIYRIMTIVIPVLVSNAWPQVA